jgi:dihydroorotase-like cyclic amidohydrolase
MRQSRRTHELLGLNSRRGRIGRDYVADLQLVDENAKSDFPPSLQYRVKRVLVAGDTVWENGKRTGNNPGVFLRGR